MLHEPITLRRCFAAARRRLGAITLMGLLCVALLFGAYIILSIVLTILIVVVGLLAGVMAAAQLPPWVATASLIVASVAAVALGVFLICFVAARVIFLPQIVMIEGESAGSALGRAIRLGKGNWYRFGAIVLFTYFVQLSILSALTLPVLAGLYMAGTLNAEFLVSPTWSILYTSFGQTSSLLTLPISVVSFTLLYFDSRVRKEAYDVDLLAREMNPEFYWQPPVQPAPFGYQMPPQAASGRAYVQTSPLGLAGFRPVSQNEPATTARPEDVPPKSDSDPLLSKFERAAADLNTPDESRGQASGVACKTCGSELLPGARFCMNCGTATN